MIQSAITSRGQTTLPKPVREALGVQPGDRVRYAILENNEVRIIPVRPLSRLFGSLPYHGKPVSLNDMRHAIFEGTRRAGLSTSLSPILGLNQS